MSQDKEITELDECTTPAPNDLMYIVAVSDTSGSAEGTSKYAQISGTVRYVQTAAELSAGVTPTNYQYPHEENGNIF